MEQQNILINCQRIYKKCKRLFVFFLAFSTLLTLVTLTLFLIHNFDKILIEIWFILSLAIVSIVLNVITILLLLKLQSLKQLMR